MEGLEKVTADERPDTSGQRAGLDSESSTSTPLEFKKELTTGHSDKLFPKTVGELTFLQQRMEDLLVSAEREVLQQAGLQAGHLLLGRLWNGH